MTLHRLGWIVRDAAFTGGAEHYVHRTAALLEERGVESTLLYDPNASVEADYLRGFARAFPLADVALQVAGLGLDLAYAHQTDASTVAKAISTGVPVARFLHDHAPFCVREHKFSPWTGDPCTRPVGVHCLSCTGGIVRKHGRITFARLAPLARDLELQAGVRAWITGSDYMKRHAAAHGLPADRIHTVPLFADEGPAPRPHLRSGLLYVGALNRGKGVDLLLNALARTPGLRLTMVGEGPARDWVEKRASRPDLKDRVHLAGRIDTEGVRARMDRARLLVIPSRTPETFSLAGVEAAARGLPSVAADVGGISQWLVNGVTGRLVLPNDVAGLADTLEDLGNDGDECAALGARARQRWASHFRPEHHADALLTVLERATRTLPVVPFRGAA